MIRFRAIGCRNGYNLYDEYRFQFAAAFRMTAMEYYF